MDSEGAREVAYHGPSRTGFVAVFVSIGPVGASSCTRDAASQTARTRALPILPKGHGCLRTCFIFLAGLPSKRNAPVVCTGLNFEVENVHFGCPKSEAFSSAPGAASAPWRPCHAGIGTAAMVHRVRRIGGVQLVQAFCILKGREHPHPRRYISPAAGRYLVSGCHHEQLLLLWLGEGLRCNGAQ